MHAIILAGGLGTRLRSMVPTLPKPMAPVAGRPFLAWILDALAKAGCTQVVLAVGYRHEAISERLGKTWQGMALDYSVESAPLGTGGALRLAADYVKSLPVFVLNGDTFLDLDYQAMLAAYQAGGETMSMAVCPVDDVCRYGTLEVADGHVCAFVEKGRSGPGLINAGSYLLSEQAILRIPERARYEPFSFEQQLLMPMVADLRPAAFVADGLFIDIGVPEDYAKAQQLFSGRR